MKGEVMLLQANEMNEMADGMADGMTNDMLRMRI